MYDDFSDTQLRVRVEMLELAAIDELRNAINLRVEFGAGSFRSQKYFMSLEGAEAWIQLYRRQDPKWNWARLA